MRYVAREVLNKANPSAANLAYGRLAKRIGEHLDWEPDLRDDETPFWMSVVAEGWEPPSTESTKREYESVMVPVLANFLLI